MIVLYEKGDTCTHLAGPPRIGAYPGNRIIWRIFNNCQKEARVEITDLRLSPGDRDGFTYARSLKEIEEVKLKRQDDVVYKPIDPFDTGARGKTVAGRGDADFPAMDELTLKVKDKGIVQAGLYTYIVTVNGNPDEGDIDIWR